MGAYVVTAIEAYEDLIGDGLTPVRPAIDLDEARRFLELLAPGEPVTFQTFDDGPQKRKELAKVKHGTFEQHRKWLTRMNQRGVGIFVTVNATNGERKASDVVRVRALFVDIDDPAPGTLERLRAAELPPSMIVESSPGKLHAYWLTGAVGLSEFTALQLRLIAEWGADVSGKDLSRVLRVPGFLHLKNPSAPQLPRILDAPGHRYGRELVDWVRRCGTSAAPESDDDTAELLALVPGRGGNIANALAELCGGEDVHANALTVVGHLAHYGLPDSTIRGLFEHALAPAVADARGGDRAEELTGSELDRMLAGAQKFAPVQATGPALELVSVGDLLTDEIPPVRFIFAPLFPRGEVTLFSADGGTGKSTLALGWAAHVACGKAWAGLSVEPGRVLFVSLEDPADVCRLRLRSVVQAYGLDAAAVGDRVWIADGTKGMGALMALREGVLRPTEVLAELMGLLPHGPFDLIVIDNASDAFGGNENDRQQVREFMRVLRRLAVEADAAVLSLAHVDKATVRGAGEGSRYSGSTAWHNSARSRLALFKRDGLLVLVHEKSNLAARMDREVPLSFRGGVPVPVEMIEGFAESADIAEQREADTILRLMREVIAAGVDVPAAQAGPKTARHVLMRLPGAPGDWRMKSGKDRFEAAMQRLHMDGRVRVEEHRKASNRHASRRLVPCELAHSDSPDDLI